ncbi:MAG: apolipoprotein N-acyltransferase [Geminicoccaceae bacterium]
MADEPQWLERLHRRPYIAALALGAISGTAFAPWHFIPGLLGFAVWLVLIVRAPSPRSSFVLGWMFGFGQAVVMLHWIALAFFVDAERFGALAIPAIGGLCVAWAVFPGVVAWLLDLRPWKSVAAAALVLAPLWVGAEMLRGYLTAFPWNPIGQVWAFGAIPLQATSLIGIYGLGILTVALASLPASLLVRDSVGRAWLGVALMLVIGLAGWGTWRVIGHDWAFVDGPRLRLVQPNLDGHHNWNLAERQRWFEDNLQLSLNAAGEGISHIVWAESAATFPLDSDLRAREYVASVAPDGGAVLTGNDRYDFERPSPVLWNSLVAVTPDDRLAAVYVKADLVPFGEYLPFRFILSRIGLKKLTSGTVDFEAGPGRQTLDVPGLPPFSPLICYEAIFAGRAIAEDGRAQFMLNITNDAWFGRSFGPYQHFAMARVRAIEEGVPLIRVANTGISGSIDAVGRVVELMPLGERGVLDVDIPTAIEGRTLFARYGHDTTLALALTLMVAGVLTERRARAKRG